MREAPRDAIVAAMEPTTVVRRFVDEYQTGASERAFAELLDPDILDHSRPPGNPPRAAGVRQAVALTGDERQQLRHVVAISMGSVPSRANAGDLASAPTR